VRFGKKPKRSMGAPGRNSTKKEKSTTKDMRHVQKGSGVLKRKKGQKGNRKWVSKGSAGVLLIHLDKAKT